MAMSCSGSNSGDPYLTSYESLDVHELMLRDEARTGAYAQFISANKHLFADKIVVDVGAGTGILSLFAAKAGAKQVFAIEASNLCSMCAELVTCNGYDDRITVLHGRAEDIQLPDGVKADILISEWMGFYLLHESMLTSVIVARDRFLDPNNGIMVPSAASIFICPVSMKTHHEQNMKQWSNYYGFDFSPFAKANERSKSTQPLIVTVPSDECLADPQLVVRLDLAFVDEDDIKSIRSRCMFTIKKNDLLRGFAVWFDVEFECTQCATVLSTAPGQPKTHWEQTVLMLPDTLLVSKEDDVYANLLLSRDETNPRRYNITVEMPEANDTDEGEEGDGEGMLDNEDAMDVADKDDVLEKVDQSDELERMIRSAMEKPS